MVTVARPRGVEGFAEVEEDLEEEEGVGVDEEEVAGFRLGQSFAS